MQRPWTAQFAAVLVGALLGSTAAWAQEAEPESAENSESAEDTQVEDTDAILDDEEWAASILVEAHDLEQPGPATVPNGSMAVLFLGAGLVVLVGWWLVRRRNQQSDGDRRLMCHLQSLRLGPRSQLSIVEVSNRKLVIGIANGAIQLLTELDPQKRPAAPAPRVARQAIEPPASSELWSRFPSREHTHIAEKLKALRSNGSQQ